MTAKVDGSAFSAGASLQFDHEIARDITQGAIRDYGVDQPGGDTTGDATRKLLLERVNRLESELRQVSMKGKLISQELDLFRQRRVVFWSDRFRNTFDAWNLMNPGFQQLKDDTALFAGSIESYRLQPSLSLLRLPFLSYRIKLPKPNLCSLMVAPVVDVPLSTGEVCIRIFSANDNFLATSMRSVAEIRDEYPLQLDFAPIAESDKTELLIRVFVQGVDAPVRIFELRKYALGGFGRLSTRPFFGYRFAE